MLEELKAQVCRANLELVEAGLVLFTFGNASGIDREKGLVAIKPSGVAYSHLTPEKMVLVSLESGDVVEGALAPSSDTPAHLALYRAFEAIGGVTHTHSPWATAWAQAGEDIPALGTTHADYFRGPVPCSRELSAEEIAGDYEARAGEVIVECFEELDVAPGDVPAALVSGHGPFTWGVDAADAVHNAAVLERVAEMAYRTVALNPDAEPISDELLEKHYLRKHGEDAYYGQR
jgi:L-ribulose-5-phosphate 4-epimerase